MSLLFAAVLETQTPKVACKPTAAIAKENAEIAAKTATQLHEIERAGAKPRDQHWESGKARCKPSL